MKLINKYQEGGVYMPPFYTFRSRPYTSTETGPTKPDKGSKSDEITNKDMLKMLEHLDGLPSDMALITQTLQNFYSGGVSRGSNIVGANAFSDRDTSNIAAEYVNILSQMKVANFNKKEYDNAYAQVSKNGGINEFAITDRGQLVCSDGKGDFKLMTPEELKESKGYSPLTNSELLYYRAQDPSLANNNRILSVVQNGIGMEVVTKMIQDVLKGMGSSEDSQEGYIGQRHGQLITGLQAFEQAAQDADGEVNFNGTIHDLYKYKYLTKSQAEQASAAMAYIYQTLPTNAKAMLKVKSDLTDQGALTLLQQLVASQVTGSRHLDLTMTSEPGGKGGSGSSSGSSESDFKAGQITNIQLNRGGMESEMKIDEGGSDPKGITAEMTMYGRQYNGLTDKNGNAVTGDMALSAFLDKTNISQVVDLNNVQFGDQKVSRDELQNIMYNGSGVMRVLLPVTTDDMGNTVVDLQILERYENAVKQIRDLQKGKGGADLSEQEVEQIYRDNKLDVLLNNGKLDMSKMRPYLVTTGYSSDGLINVDPDSRYLKNYGDSGGTATQISQRIMAGLGLDSDEDVDTSFWIRLNNEYMLKAAIYIPLDNNLLQGVIADNQKVANGTADYLEGLYQASIRLKLQNGFGVMDSGVLGL